MGFVEFGDFLAVREFCINVIFGLCGNSVSMAIRRFLDLYDFHDFRFHLIF